jgi:hypothetical protein
MAPRRAPELLLCVLKKRLFRSLAVTELCDSSRLNRQNETRQGQLLLISILRISDCQYLFHSFTTKDRFGTEGVVATFNFIDKASFALSRKVRAAKRESPTEQYTRYHEQGGLKLICHGCTWVITSSLADKHSMTQCMQAIKQSQNLWTMSGRLLVMCSVRYKSIPSVFHGQDSHRTRNV